MRKSQELSDPNSCFNRAGADNNIFVGVDWDPAVPGMIRAWCLERIKLGLNSVVDAQITEARALADEIERNLAEIRYVGIAWRNLETKNHALNPAAAWPFPNRDSR